MPGMPGAPTSARALAEVWAARAWNVFNEGRPFSIVYPLLVLLAAAPRSGWRRTGSLGARAWARRRGGARARRASRSRCADARCCGSPRSPRCRCSSRGARRRCSPARSPATRSSRSSSGARVYYHLRTGAPWTNGLRFWRLVLTNSDPTSGNALEQVPKLLIALSAATLLAEEPTAGLARPDARPPWRSPPALGALAARAIREAPAGAIRSARAARAQRRAPRGAGSRGGCT